MENSKLRIPCVNEDAGPEVAPVRRLSLTRRRLLQAASAGAVVHAFGRVADAQEIVARREVEPLSVGYLEDSDLLPSLRLQPWRRKARGARIVPAARMGLGDQSLALSTIEMRVHGFYPGIPPRRFATFSTLVLTVFFPSFDPLRPEPLPFYSWQGKLWPGTSRAAPLSFLVPLRDDGGLELVLEVFDGRPTAAGQGAARILRGSGRQVPLGRPLELRSLYTDFTVDWYEGRPKLRRGFYFLGLEPGAWRSPDEPPGPLGRKVDPATERWSLAVSFERVAEDDPRLT